MTTIESHKVIFEHFVKNDFVNYEQLIKLVPVGADKNAGIASLISALEELCENKILFKYQVDKQNENTTNWILKKPLSMNEQAVVINGITALNISSIINTFCEITSQKEFICNPLNITANDIDGLLNIINIYSEANQEQEQIKKQSKKEK